MESIIVSQSEADTFNICKRRHFYAFANGGLQKRKFSDALARGILGHKCLEIIFAALQKDPDYEAARKAGLVFLQTETVKPDANYQIIADVMRLVTLFLDTYKDRIQSWEILHVEGEFWLNVTERIRFPFKPDLLIKEKGQVAVVDHKYVYDFFTADMIALLGQIPKYVGALRAMDIVVKQGIYIQLRHRKMKDMSAPNVLRIEPIPLNNARIIRTFKDQVEITKEIAAMKKLPLEVWDNKATRIANNMVCKSCMFKDLCIAELNGSDGKLIRQVDYEPNTYGYKELES